MVNAQVAPMVPIKMKPAKSLAKMIVRLVPLLTQIKVHVWNVYSVNTKAFLINLPVLNVVLENLIICVVKLRSLSANGANLACIVIKNLQKSAKIVHVACTVIHWIQ